MLAILIALAACDTSDAPPIAPRAAPFRPGSTGSPPPPARIDAGSPGPTVTFEAIAVNRDEACATVGKSTASVCWRASKPPVDAADFIQLSIRFDEAIGNGDWFLGRDAVSTFVWGSGALGANGQPDANAAGTPVLLGSRRTAYAPERGAAGAGSRHACIVTASEELYCWGDDASCQVSAGSTCAPQVRGITDLSTLFGPSVLFMGVAAGAAHTCAIGATGSTGSVYCWGANASGETGQPLAPTTEPAAVPFVPPVETKGLQLASGDHHACAIVKGNLYCWGKNDKQQASLASQDPVVAPALVDLSDVVGEVSKLALGGDRTCFVVRALGGKQPSLAFCFRAGRLHEVPAIEDIVELAVSDTYACAVARLRRSTSNARELYCWSGDDAPARVTGFDPR